jgi:uncharacterized membrane protein YqjE
MAGASARTGLFASLRSAGTTLLGMAQTRLELLGNEFETQKLAILRMLVLALAILFCAGLGLIVVVVLLTAAFWEQRIAVLSAIAVVFFGTAFGLYRALMRTIDASEAPFAATLEELREDVRRLQAATNDDAPRR